uniref:Ferredoxin-thioredoxin reductase, catalytic chain n=1 Tax=Dictyopteris divaricata TaxID=156996 RepID=A0A2I4Q2F8_9PHAE|nr:ferredoxin-thioredoxin reductase beta subunit [Dictyopteris divaricata]YP_010205320.1 ferredoxin-thioredoxin reductase beta subunit [Grateloupia livida]AQZ25032.1 ferredoxin-thioredoxin reductase beta subunit [Dictyopteris divaricata]UAV85889.1 ferredoxin-thioredoxin reductase beta subunit [Grateloupia livida]
MNPRETQNISNSVESIQRFAEIYTKRTNTFFCFDPSITAIVLTGLVRHKEKYGVPLCPCRNYFNEEAEVDLNYWICPCVAMRERKECHCKLFLTPDDEYSSKNQTIDINLIYDNL